MAGGIFVIEFAVNRVFTLRVPRIERTVIGGQFLCYISYFSCDKPI